MKDIQKIVNDTFLENFGKTPLTERINDILGETLELIRFTDIKNLKEETGDLLCSLLQLCNESGWNAEDLIKYVCEEKIPKRKLQYKSLGRKYKIALLGGSYNPITLGHIQLAQYVLNTSKSFDEVWIMPNYNSITGKDIQSFEHRFNMCKLAAKVDGRIKIFDYEQQKQLAGETYHLVKTLLADKDYDNYNFSFIIGLDNANVFDTWYNYNDLERLIRFVIVPRKGYKPLYNAWYLKEPHIFLNGNDEDINIMEVSSTFVRDKIKNNDTSDILNYINKDVYQYIIDNNLYK